ncbi:PREDICTED: uncharacterized protein At1g01500-like isoform X2 [Ipomoea nil]|uniref:uncharacterized protein At1g01500-like isoform X2 n=1 Tax=Ipomoea nil TaxID=35883 RepID=UPI0009009290|nr:PREDICTED: uncharacterized protein At1g01500-like isoform X2 [Ipomoea nil]
MENRGEELPMVVYQRSNFKGGCLEIRLFYVRVAPCAVNAVPDYLTLRHLRRERGVSLAINGSRIPASDASSITLRRDRVDKESSEVTYVSTDSVWVSGPVEFEVLEKEDGLILCGSLERVDLPWSNGNVLDSDSPTGWSMDCHTAASGASAFFQPNLRFCSPSIEVYVAGCFSGAPVILTKTIQVSPRKKKTRQALLDAIPEEEEAWKVQKKVNEPVRRRKTEIIEEADIDTYKLDEKTGQGLYSEEMCADEDGQLSWFNAGVRVGVGIGLGMCLGVGVGVGLFMHSYQTMTRNLRRRFF